MKSFHFKGLLTNEGWQANKTVHVDNSGKITSIDGQVLANTEQLNGFAIPGFQNAHSHAFQYAMAGLAEVHSTGKNPDDFWSWRDAMYALALSISPDNLEKIAQMLYAEMLRHGYTHVAEFHYVHHDKNGNAYGSLSEMGERLIAAAKSVGIGITLIPIFYQKGGFGQEPKEGQKRFISDGMDAYIRLFEASRNACQYYEHANVALGIHSMRGVEPELIAELAKNGDQTVPFHIHVSEQLKEIEDSLAYLGKRPVEWMLDNIEMNDRFHLVHATHLTTDETKWLALSKANVVLCPSTEGNLGDGIFPLKQFQEEGGSWSIGTDSHVGLNPLEELRILDYGQRLISHKRNTFYSKNQGDGGAYAIDMALKSGRKAMNNFDQEYFKVGDFFDAIVYNAEHPLLATTSLQNLSSTIVFSADSAMNLATISKGQIRVKQGVYQQAEQVNKDFIKTIEELKNR